MQNLLSYSCYLLIAACALTRPAPQLKTSQPRALRVESAQVDQLGNLYVANEVNEVRKLNAEGDVLGYYSNNSLGNIGLIDATSPMKVMIFYPSFSTCVILDRRLLETSRFNLIDMGFGEINLISFSRDGTLWIFDDHAQRLYKVDQSGEILQTSEDLRLEFDERILPSTMRESGGNLFLNVPGRGILIFDLFGQYKTQVLQEGISDFQVTDDQSIIYRSGNSMIVHNPFTFQRKSYLLPQEFGMAKVLLTQRQIIVVKTSGVERHLLSDLIQE